MFIFGSEFTAILTDQVVEPYVKGSSINRAIPVYFMLFGLFCYKMLKFCLFIHFSWFSLNELIRHQTMKEILIQETHFVSAEMFYFSRRSKKLFVEETKIVENKLKPSIKDLRPQEVKYIYIYIMSGISDINVYVFSLPTTTKRQNYRYNFGISGNG